ncbi:MAG TPA: SDR family oxidoreductase [Acidimicrobiales bacterium]|nr:SDR family oxidoreductase [Acidimicrobiales bacterium]
MRVALVTGASRGIGKASAVALAHAGFDVAVAARTIHEGSGIDDSDSMRRPLPGSLESTAAVIEAAGQQALPIRMDLLERPSLDAGVELLLDRWGRIDVLVNNAVNTGPGSMDQILDLTIPVVEEKLAANAVAPLVLIKLVLPAMLKQGGGTIINVTSPVAENDPPAPAGSGGWGLAYAMSKGALHRIAGILAVELGDRGIRAFNLDPGFVVTERMAMVQKEHGLQSYKGAPPSVPGAVIAWLATEAAGAAAGTAAGAATESNGRTVRAQKLALELDLHPDWREHAR